MAIKFTEKQQKVIDARNRNLLVSAAAGSGKTAVLVERIIRMITEGENPPDIDRLLVVTFTKAAAQQMREKIAAAIAASLAEDPGNRHLQRQETLLHNAQITTIDGFCSFLLRNNFSDIGIDPGYRLMDEMEGRLLKRDVLKDILEECYQQKEEAFLSCVEYFCPGIGDAELEEAILKLYEKAVSMPFPELYLAERAEDYRLPSEKEEDFFALPFVTELLRVLYDKLRAQGDTLDSLAKICLEPGGPYAYGDVVEKEAKAWNDALCALEKAEGAGLYYGMAKLLAEPPFEKRLPNTKMPDVDEELKEYVKDQRTTVKDKLGKILDKYFSKTGAEWMREMRLAEGPVRTLAELAGTFAQRFREVKRERNVIDFSDLEHFALDILVERQEDGKVVPSKTCLQYRNYYQEILIDEYQDCNDVQETLFSFLSGESEGRFDRFMVGDVKQSIYKFRMARPEIFMEKLQTYTEDDTQTERIDLDRNFRSREEVLGAVNAVFRRIMRPEIGRILYDEKAELKLGASYPVYEACRPEILAAELPPRKERGEDEPGTRQREAMLIAGRIREMVGKYLVTDKETGELRPARYGDMVILLRATAGWDTLLRETLEENGIPCYVTARAGYFETEEIRQIINFLTILDNPRQDIPLYGAMRSFFGGFTEEECALIRGQEKQRTRTLREADGEMQPAADDSALYSALCRFDMEGEDALRDKCGKFLHKVNELRGKLITRTIRELLTELIAITGYEEYLRSMPAGEQRAANLRMLLFIASTFEKTSYTGLFQFLRYIELMKAREQDYGEANTLDENADVVRIMTIHKSKGLEFPICFVAGMGQRFSGKDVNGALLLDSNMGFGIDCVDVERRTKTPTLRKIAVEEAIRRDTLGEELRILYVALTRAKEKLILTFNTENFAKKLQNAVLSAGTDAKAGAAGAEKIADCNSYMDLLLLALGAMEASGEVCPFDMKIVDTAETEIDAAESETRRTVRKAVLDELLTKEEIDAENTDPRLALTLRKKFSYRYSADALEGLYTKVSVSALKAAHIHQFAQPEEGESQDGARTFDVPEEKPEILPRFMRETENVSEEKHFISGAARGTAVHLCMRFLDFERFYREGGLNDENARGFLEELAAQGILTEAEAASVGTRAILTFLKTDLAHRMAEADRQGKLYREQPFVMGLPAKEIDDVFPESEEILVQGIVDAFFIYDGGICVLDYKTDRVREAKELTERYKTQLDYYEKALSKAFGLPVKERIIYSFALRQEIRL